MSVRLSVRPPKSGSVGPQPLAPRHPSLGRPSRPAWRPARPGGPFRTAPGRTSESVPLWRPLSLSRVLARRPMPTNHHPPPSRESASARPSPRAARWRCAPGRERRCTAGRLRRSARGRPLLIERGSLEWERVMIAWLEERDDLRWRCAGRRWGERRRLGGWVRVRCVGQDGRLAAASTQERRIPPFHVQMGMASTGIGINWYYSSVGFKLADWRPTDTETRDNGAKGRPSKSRIDSYANWSATQHHRRWPASSTPTDRPRTGHGGGRHRHRKEA